MTGGAFSGNYFSTGFASNPACKPSGSSFNTKRKRTSWTSEDVECEQAKVSGRMRIGNFDGGGRGRG
jgi:hypothetical protein